MTEAPCTLLLSGPSNNALLPRMPPTLPNQKNGGIYCIESYLLIDCSFIDNFAFDFGVNDFLPYRYSRRDGAGIEELPFENNTALFNQGGRLFYNSGDNK